MLVEEVAAIYRAFVDESRANWHTGVVSTFLKQGYNVFRRRIARQQPFIYATSVDIATSGYSYDLAVGPPSILGASPTAAAAEKLLELRTINSDGSEGAEVSIVENPDHGVRNYRSSAWLRGTVLNFNYSGSESLRLWYMPVSTVDWTKTVSGDNEFIDDLNQFHELIAVYAAEYYGVRDGAAPRVKSIKDRAEKELAFFLLEYSGNRQEINIYNG